MSATLIIREACYVAGGGEYCTRGDHGTGQLEDAASPIPEGFHDRELRPDDVRDALTKIAARETWHTADPLDAFIEALR